MDASTCTEVHMDVSSESTSANLIDKEICDEGENLLVYQKFAAVDWWDFLTRQAW